MRRSPICGQFVIVDCKIPILLRMLACYRASTLLRHSDCIGPTGTLRFGCGSLIVRCISLGFIDMKVATVLVCLTAWAIGLLHINRGKCANMLDIVVRQKFLPVIKKSWIVMEQSGLKKYSRPGKRRTSNVEGGPKSGLVSMLDTGFIRLKMKLPAGK